MLDVDGVPGWNINKHLEGRVPKFVGFTGNPMSGEAELAIPKRVPPENIVRAGEVVEGRGGRLRVKEWVNNPNYKGKKQ